MACSTVSAGPAIAKIRFCKGPLLKNGQMLLTQTLTLIQTIQHYDAYEVAMFSCLQRQSDPAVFFNKT